MIVTVAVALVAATAHARAVHDRPALRHDPRLDEAARVCGEHGILACVRKLGVRTYAAGIDTAWGQQTATQAVAAWLASPAHRTILLSPRYGRVGAFRVGRRWVEVFA